MFLYLGKCTENGKFNYINKSIEQINFKEDGASSVVSDIDEDPSLKPYLTFRERLYNLFESRKFQVAIIALVIIDCLIVIAELLLEVKHHELHDNIAPHVLHYMSIAILSVFIVEILFKIYAFRIEFFHHKLEVFDAFVVFLSFGLDVGFQEQQVVSNGMDLIIILRLWRLARILNGVVMSIKTQSEHKLQKERQQREAVEQELSKCITSTKALEQEIEMLRTLLHKHGIKEVPLSVKNNIIPEKNTISVVAEVNEILPV